MIPAHTVSQVKTSTDLVALIGEYVDLRKRGSRWMGMCPFHGPERTPSFGINADNYWKCFGCGEGGDCLSFLMKIEGITFSQALTKLADRSGISLEGKPISRRAANWARDEAAMCSWYWARFRARQLAAIHAAIEGPESWLDALGAPLRWMDGLTVEQRFQAFRARCTERDRQQWRAETAEAREFADMWMGLAA